MPPSIRPVAVSYPASGPAPQFVVGAGRGRLYDAQLAIDPILFNGANANRRRDSNFFSSFSGTRRVPAVRTPTDSDQFFYDTPRDVWLALRRAPVLYYRLLTFDLNGAHPATSLADLDYEQAPFVVLLAGRIGLHALAEIDPARDGVLGADPPPPQPTPAPPAFTIHGGTQLYYTVELATDPMLFLGINSYKRHRANFFSSALGMQDIPGEERQTIAGVDIYTLPQRVWENLRRSPRLFYRAITTRSVFGLGRSYSFDDPGGLRAPFLTIGQIGAPANAAVDHRDSGMLGDPMPPALVVRGDARTFFVVELAATAAELQAGAGATYVSSGPHPLVEHVASFILPDAAWQALAAGRFIYYRVTTFTMDAVGARVNVARSPVDDGHRMPGIWGGLPIDSSNAVFVNAAGSVVTGRLESDHGPRWVTNGRLWHPGIDIPVNNVPIYAVADGTVDHVGNALGWIRLDHGSYETSYLHMRVPFTSTVPVAQGARFRRGYQLGLAGNTGTVGAHLHFELENAAKNPLNRLRRTETSLPQFSGSAANNRATHITVEMKAPNPATHRIAIVSLGATTGLDKDLVSVDTRILDRMGQPEAENGYLLDYSAVRSSILPSGMLTSTGTEANSVHLLFGGSDRITGLPNPTADSRREFLIVAGTTAAGANPSPFYAPLAAGGVIGAHPVGWYDMYVIPGFTTQGAVAEDWFNFMWHVNSYDDDSGPHWIVAVLTDLQGQSTAEVQPFGIDVSAITALNTPAGSPVSFPLRLHDFDQLVAPIRMHLTVPAGWTATGSWPGVFVNLPAGNDAIYQVTVTPPAAAAMGDHADIEVLAESTRLAGGAFRHRAILRTTVANPPPTPRISINAATLYSDGLPPLFRIESGPDRWYEVEVSSRSDFFGRSSERGGGQYFTTGSRPIPTGVDTYALPVVAWSQLVTPPTKQLYYRLRSSPDATWGVTHETGLASISISPAWPPDGPEITPVHLISPPAPALAFSVAPAFRLHTMPNFYYAVEVATREELFDDERLSCNEHNFFSSWFGNSAVPARRLRSDRGHAIYHLPEPAWDRLKQEFAAGRAQRLHYIVRQARTPSDLFGTIHSSTHAFMA
ncbi:MAG TPA: M23 family metallopeptidase [Candidatus Nitrosopolaris sp.]|nr:M23 family metallopeptidase [Candidatus Nitrosopolaris sp.]